MLSVLAKQPPRTCNAHNSSIYFDEGHSSISFTNPPSRYLVTNHWPPLPKGAICALQPPLHWHRFQDEIFHVLAGTARFTIDGKGRLARAGDVVNVPKRAVHTFTNASETEEMIVEFILEPSRRDRDETFFRK